jgi:hypothetical protein
MAKSSNMLASNFVSSLLNPLPEPLKCLVVLLGTFLSWTVVFEWHLHFKAGPASVEDTEVQGGQAPAKR